MPKNESSTVAAAQEIGEHITRWVGQLTRRRYHWPLWVALCLLAAMLLWLLMPENVARLFRRDLTWQSIQNNGVWRVGMDPSFPPFEWLDEQGQPTGYDVELANRIAAQWGVEVELVAIGFDSLGDALRAGRIDSVISAFPYDERLTRDIAYSRPYFDGGIVLATHRDQPIATIDGLQGQRVAVEWGSMGDMVGRRLQRNGLSVELVQFDAPDAAIDALIHSQGTSTQTVAALLIDHVTLRVAQVQGAPLLTVGEVFESNPYVIAMPIQAYELQAAVAQALTTLQTDGTLAALEATWFGRHP